MPENVSTASLIASASASQLQAFLDSLTDAEAELLIYDWRGFLARPNQLPPTGSWRTWLVLAGRGFGKTRTGAEWVREQVEESKANRIALVAPTAGDARDVMVEGESGILAISPPWNRPQYEPSKRRLTWPNGALATLYSADEPERLRGPQHDAAWCDEICSWVYPEAWDMLQFGLRLGDDPRVVVTTTPKPVKLLKALLQSATTVITRGSTYENRSNLAPAFFSEIVSQYEGTRLGRQELNAEVLEDTPGALWSVSLLDENRIARQPEMKCIVVAVDPSVTNTSDSDEAGIIVAGLGADNHGYLLADLSRKDTPDGWARAAVNAYRAWHADKLVAEVNNGGDLVRTLIKTIDSTVAYTAVRAAHGKYTRAEPIAALYEQGRVHHVGSFPELESQMTTFVPGADKSPDRMDALVWAFTQLMLGPTEFHREHVRPR